MLNIKLNAHWGFTPVALCSPKNAILPEQVINHRSKRRGGMEDRHGSSRKNMCCNVVKNKVFL